MLRELYIENIALIKKASVNFDMGLNVLTGETGAGKTILIGAIQAVLGERTSRDLIRTGEKKAVVSAMFSDISPRAAEAVEALGFTPDEDCGLMIQREITASGNICRINGMPATVSVLKQIGNCLLAIHGQFDTQALADTESHRDFIDRFGELEADIEAYSHIYHELMVLRKKLGEAKMSEAQKAQRLDFLNFQVNEITSACLLPGEDTALAARRDIIKNAEKIASGLMAAVDLLGGNEAQGAADAALESAEQIARIAQFLPEGDSLTERLHTAGYELRDICETLQAQSADMAYDPGEIDEIEGRLDIIYRLSRKYNGSVDDIIAQLATLQDEIDAIVFSEEHMRKIEAEEARLKEAAQAAAARLTQRRRAAGDSFAQLVQNELADLDMPAVRLAVAIAPIELASTGADHVEILFSANLGEEPKPLSKIASGGEISRVMLSIKNVLSGRDAIDTLIFDEIDAGVSGRAAHKIGGKLKQTSRGRQILCVTHLAQVAAFADHHLLIEKQTDEHATFTEVVTLDEEGRAHELARITGGEIITDTTLKNAKEMLESARKAYA